MTKNQKIIKILNIENEFLKSEIQKVRKQKKKLILKNRVLRFEINNLITNDYKKQIDKHFKK